MTPLSPLDRFLLFTTVVGMFASLAFYAAQRTARFWKEPFAHFTRASRPAQALVFVFLVAVTAIGGGKTNAPPMRIAPVVRTIPAENLPAWFVDRVYSATDANENGIPDCWEKWTHTRGFASDADLDGDGLTNLAEFWAQTDPIRADTDGDGIDDATELTGLAASVADLDPLVPATFMADELDTDEDGIPDLWEDADVPLFYGIDPDGFPWDADVPDPASDNYDVLLAVTSSRHAALSWGSGSGESILIPPCTNLALRLRLDAGEDRRVALSPHPAGGNATGLWKAELLGDWSPGRMQDTEGNRIRTTAGTIVDAESDSFRFAGVLVGTIQPSVRGPAPSRGNGPRDETGWWFRRKSIEISGTGYCAVHGTGLVVTAACENVSLPLEWSVPGCGTVADGGFEFVPGSHGWESASTEVVCTKRDGKSSILLQARERYDAVPCGQPRTNVVGACWLSSHDPDDPSDHEPRVEEHVVRYFPNCPPTTNVTVVAGFTHDTAILWIRNLVRIVTGDPMDDETDHCISLPFSQTGEIDLYSYLDGVCVSFRERFVFTVNGRSLTGHTIHMSDYMTDNDLKPSVLHVSFSFEGSREMDRMWIVLYSSNLKTGYDSWKTKFSGLTWTASLPPVYPNIALSTNSNGTVSLVKQDYPGWERPHAISSFLHHDAVYEMRSESVGIHGHQATYRADGTVIETTLAAGTADYSHPLSTHAHWPTIIQDDHYVNDVVPFLRALSLDGNPGIYNKRYIPTNLTRPCLYQGTNINEYILRRPTFPSGKH